MIAIVTRDAEPVRLQVHLRSVAGKRSWQEVGYRVARANSWHCGHWHRTAEDAVACAVAKGAPMD